MPGSDLAGEIVALGDEVKGWNVGDRVCSNFCTDHIFGDTTDEIKLTGLGAPIDGVLTEYKVLPAHVSACSKIQLKPMQTHHVWGWDDRPWFTSRSI